MSIKDEWREYVPDVTFELIPIKNLVSNQNYQRNLSPRHIAKMVENFDLQQINLVKISRREGANLVMNGQHTIETVAAKSGSRDTPVWCMVYTDLEYEREADIFANQMRFTKALSPYDVFIAKVEAGYDEQVTIKTLVESYDLSISSTHATGTICAVAALEWIYETYGFHVLDDTLRLTLATWEGEVASFTGNMLRAIARIIACYQNRLDYKVFSEKLGYITLKEIIRSARERNNGYLGYAETIVNYYNKKNRINGLPITKLYTSKVDKEDSEGLFLETLKNSEQVEIGSFLPDDVDFSARK